MLENVNPDLSDSEYIEHDGRDPGFDAMTPGPIGSDLGDAPTPAAERDQDGDEEEEDEGGGDGDIDEELAAELDLALGDEGEEGDDDDEDEDEDDSDEEDEDDEDDETNQARKLLNEEIRDLEAAVAKKNHEIASSANPLIRVSYSLPYSRASLTPWAETIRGRPKEAESRP